MAENNPENNEQNIIPPDDYERELMTDLDDDTPDKPKGMALHTKILIGLLVGVLGGLVVNWTLGGDNPNVVWAVENFTRPIGQLFLNLLLMIVVPLVFSSLVVGVAGIGDIRKLGRIGVKSFAYRLIISAISVVIGLGLANTIRPGERISPEIAAQLKEKFSSGAKTSVEAQQAADKAAKSDTALMSVVKTIVPSNVFNSISGASPNMLHIMFFALIVGIAITLLPAPVSAPFVGLMESVFAITSKIIDIIMKFAPYAVACLLFNNIAQFGLDLLQSLAWFVLTVLLGLSLHFFGVYSLSIWFLSKMNPLEFFQARSHRDRYGVFDFFFERDFADGSARFGRKSRRAEAYQQLCPDGRRDCQSKRHGTLRRRYGFVSGTTRRRRTDCRTAIDGRLSGDFGRHRHGRRSVGFDSVYHRHSGDDRH